MAVNGSGSKGDGLVLELVWEVLLGYVLLFVLLDILVLAMNIDVHIISFCVFLRFSCFNSYLLLNNNIIWFITQFQIFIDLNPPVTIAPLLI